MWILADKNIATIPIKCQENRQTTMTHCHVPVGLVYCEVCESENIFCKKMYAYATIYISIYIIMRTEKCTRNFSSHRWDFFFHIVFDI